MEITMNLEDVETLHPILKQFPVVQSAALLVDSNLILLKTFQTKETHDFLILRQQQDHNSALKAFCLFKVYQ